MENKTEGYRTKTTENISEQQPQIADDQDIIIIIPTQATFDFTEQEHQQDTGKGSTTQKPNDAASQVIECFLHHTVNQLHLEKTIYIMNPFAAGAVLFENRTTVRKQSLSKVNFANYKAIVSFVNIKEVHWKFLMRNIHHRDREWADVEFKGDVMKHPVQQDGYNCGVIVIMMAKAVMKAFPKLPNMEFGTTPKEMAQERTALALEILQASVFDAENNCSMCSKHNPPCPGPSIKWVSCCFQLLCFVQFAG
ncbi:Heat-inducible transcription repressor HrcA [Labeo rohita]|uniref:Heat-inducible transcription repressor HrcA n=1 Tax=Labeo rohita TaxID=84645 RepID=A0ABQ8L9Y3_LABRO|nr:Heat-inducible transcription repressor HrcA [Labeo rohita]